VRRFVCLTPTDVLAPRSTVLQAQGIPPDVAPTETTLDLFDAACELFNKLGEPRGVVEDVDRESFGNIYRGDGDNAAETPLDGIWPQAHRLALFVVTVGSTIDSEIRRLLDRNELALAFMLDSVASAAADRAAQQMSRNFLRLLLAAGAVPPLTRALPYSPGYCGWHVSGQRALFDRLRPDEVGVELSKSCLMRPLKSVSGVIVVAEPEVHSFLNAYPFCGDCIDRQCRERIAEVVLPSRPPFADQEDHYEEAG